MRKQLPKLTRRRQMWASLARTCCDAALDESVAPELRAYYAKLALYADRKCRA